ncbi:glutaredoxin domain-containing protein [Anaerocolumna aminovalerica]|uniref:Glutaredoxin-related protein n=1 Tax=Anaerocolumna aminovalerica TaxID=1527 RepID=A0A1I5FRB8_9FIRM|nr:glutaredoxin [Anaerocolumna aminovalerica]SFO26166.1 Glutaredoxin-related protein [Anaerocolumna aminovalerica]
MKVIMYGTGICQDCVKANEVLKDYSNIELDYRNITETTTVLKEFLAYRDHESMFAPFVEAGKIGIPFFILEDGRKTFELSDFVDIEKSEIQSSIGSCSIEGKGQC